MNENTENKKQTDLTLNEAIKNIANKDFDKNIDIGCALSSLPKKKIQRNEYGLISDGSIDYHYGEDGFIDWRAMIPSKFLVPNRQAFEKNGKTPPKTIEGLDDRELVILLGGLKYLANIRGYISVKHTVTCPSSDYVVSTCVIDWIPNFETENRMISLSAIGDARPENTSSFGRYYLAAFAENRAFARAVRNFLRINIVSQDELGASTGTNMVSDSNTKMSTTILQQAMDKYNKSFSDIKNILINEKVEGVENFKDVNSIPSNLQFEIIERIKKEAELDKIIPN
jgi:hypothetical protein